MGMADECFGNLETYFKTLISLGYKSYSEVYKLMALIFAQELLYELPGVFVSERDYNRIARMLEGLYGTSCLMPHPTYKKGTTNGNGDVTPRLMEDGAVRTTLFGNIRIIE